MQRNIMEEAVQKQTKFSVRRIICKTEISQVRVKRDQQRRVTWGEIPGGNEILVVKRGKMGRDVGRTKGRGAEENRKERI